MYVYRKIASNRSLSILSAISRTYIYIELQRIKSSFVPVPSFLGKANVTHHILVYVSLPTIDSLFLVCTIVTSQHFITPVSHLKLSFKMHEIVLFI